MQVEHPNAGDGPGVPPAAVDVNGESVPVDDGVFEIGAGQEAWLRTFAKRYGVDPDSIVRDGAVDDAEACQTVKGDGEVCGRELPCPYHSESED